MSEFSHDGSDAGSDDMGISGFDIDFSEVGNN